MNVYVVSTQILENDGAEVGSGAFAEGLHRWKYKGGDDYVVQGLEREQDALAFVAAIVTTNNLGHKEYVKTIRTYEKWDEELNDLDPRSKEFYQEHAITINPNTYKEMIYPNGRSY
tara:strand:+ start:5075 stop:5422 length:348 start_codon:yes stop_codon:yes gene_type:complete